LLLTQFDIFKVDIDTPKMQGALEAYVKECQPFVSEDILTTVSDDIYELGLLEADRFASKREVGVWVFLPGLVLNYIQGSIVSLALEILACVHVNVTVPIMVGSDTLDVSPVSDAKFSVYGKCQIPSVLDYQIDTLYIHHMQRLMKDVSKGLKKLIFASNNTANWYEIFLTIFVLLVSLERVYIAQIRYIRINVSPAFYRQH
jgi:hypothetical protein